MKKAIFVTALPLISTINIKRSLRKTLILAFFLVTLVFPWSCNNIGLLEDHQCDPGYTVEEAETSSGSRKLDTKKAYTLVAVCTLCPKVKRTFTIDCPDEKKAVLRRIQSPTPIKTCYDELIFTDIYCE